MPKTKETSNHPCHFLSLPSAKRFWCRHCMSVFEDAITRWRHSRSCRYGVVNNFMRRRQLEAKALQNTTKPNPIEARLEQSVSPSEEPIVMEEEVQGPSSSTSSSVEKTNQATSNDLFRCFICHNKFSTLEEMRHHVKYPCNNKKIITDVPNPAMTVYIDEFTDRSRQWDPQPQQEEVVSSVLVPNIVSHETVHSTVDNVALQEGDISISPNKQGTNITPTNIYVNEQGETVIEVENLDLNSEGGELSLAHLLTQLSQQGIVFDKTKASQMQAHQEVTVSDPESGEVYATGTTYDPSARTSTVIKDEDEGQSTAEDAANTLAQLAIFRGYNRNKQDVGESSNVTTDFQRQYVVENSSEGGYTYTESYAMPSTSNDNNNDAHLNMAGNENHPNIKVEYQYNYLPSDQPSRDGSTPQISIQQTGTLHPGSTSAHNLGNIEVVREHDSVVQSQTVPAAVHIQGHVQGQIQQQVMSYISQPSSVIQQVQTSGEEETMLIEDFVVSNAGSSQQYQHHISVSDGIRQNESHQHMSIPAMLDASQNSYIVFNTENNATEIICNPSQDSNQNELTTVPTNVVSQSVLNHEVIENHLREQQQYIQASNAVRESVNDEMKDAEEFEVQTVTLQEIAETETDSVSFTAQNHSAFQIETPTGNTTIKTDVLTASTNNTTTTTTDLQSIQTSDPSVQLEILQQSPTTTTSSLQGVQMNNPIHQDILHETANDNNTTTSNHQSIQTNDSPIHLDIQHQSANSNSTTITTTTVTNNLQEIQMNDPSIQLDILQQTNNNNITVVPASEAGFTVNVVEETQSSCQVEEREESVSSNTSATHLPMYVVSPEGNLQLVTSSKEIVQQIQQQPQSHNV